MDSSVRDGGNVNDWCFGKNVIRGIITNLVKANIDFVELGYLKNCESNVDKTLYNTVSEAKRNIPENVGRSCFSLMTQVDKWDWNKLEPCDGSIKVIRVSFHKIRIEEGMELCKKVMEYGYICHCNPINIMGYKDDELLELIKKINEVKPSVFTIVDTFGSMSIDSARRIASILHNNLDADISISAHLHQNLGLAFAQAIEFINYFNGKRQLIIDASLDGIGRIPGNLCIELVANYLNSEFGSSYKKDYLYDAIDDYIASIKETFPWGYDPVYALSGFYNLHRTYPEYLVKKGKLKTKDIRYILEHIAPEHRVIYDEKYIEHLYREYMNVEVDDSNDKYTLLNVFSNKSVLIIAPGSSLNKTKELINKTFKVCDTSISVNFVYDIHKCDYKLFSNIKRLSQFNNVDSIGKNILTSNLKDYSKGNDFVLNHYQLTSFGQDLISEDGVLMSLNLLNELNVKEIFVAGFDSIFGLFAHYDKSMELGNSEMALELNKKRQILEQFSHMKINIITEKGCYSLKQIIKAKFSLENL